MMYNFGNNYEGFGLYFYDRIKRDKISEENITPKYLSDLCYEYRVYYERKKVCESFSDAEMKEIKIGTKIKCSYCDKVSDVFIEYMKKENMFNVHCNSCGHECHIGYEEGVDIVVFIVAGLRKRE